MFGTVIPIKEVFRKMDEASKKSQGSSYIHFGRLRIKLTKKLRLFHQKGIVCDVCGLPGTHFEFREKDDFNVALELVTNQGKGKKKRFLTVDHTVPLCIGGVDWHGNMVPMCNTYNSVWKSKFDQELKNKVVGISEDGQHYLLLA